MPNREKIDNQKPDDPVIEEAVIALEAGDDSAGGGRRPFVEEGPAQPTVAFPAETAGAFPSRPTQRFAGADHQTVALDESSVLEGVAHSFRSDASLNHSFEPGGLGGSARRRKEYDTPNAGGRGRRADADGGRVGGGVWGQNEFVSRI